ncbi:hypothetical protein AAVH_19730 [Aphelenchoides avenae]|nr:hypothetical protein AAVH_19730 [Aphelenchus avenae]
MKTIPNPRTVFLVLVAGILLIFCVCTSFNPGYIGPTRESFAKRLSIIANLTEPVEEHISRFALRPRPFDKYLLNHLNLTDPHRRENSLGPSTLPSLVFVTAASSNHFGELRALVATIDRLTPNASVVVYDLGMTANQTDEVRSWCGVEYVRFQFEKYPPHVRDLKKYAWKPLVIAEQLSRFDAFFYVDSSVRPLKADFSVFSAAVATGMLEPFLMFTPTDHSILAATHPEMYDYFPVDRDYLNSTMQAATLIYVADSAFTREFLRRFVLCALTESCIAPPGSKVKCNDVFYDTKQPELFNAYDECHRYDQSAANLIRLQMLFVDGYYRELNGSGSIPEWHENATNLPAYFASNSGEKNTTNRDEQMGSANGRAPGQPSKDETSSKRKRVIDAIERWKVRVKQTEGHFAIDRGNALWGTLRIPCLS